LIIKKYFNGFTAQLQLGDSPTKSKGFSRLYRVFPYCENWPSNVSIVKQTVQQPFIWHPWLYHYGRNWKLPGSGKYAFQIHIDMPKFHRHDKENGRRFTEPVDVVFKDIEIQIEKPQ